MTETNRSIATEDQIKFDDGVMAAKQAMEKSNKPIVLMDELGDGVDPNYRAIGWNTVWASEENRNRLKSAIIQSNSEFSVGTKHAEEFAQAIALDIAKTSINQ